LVSFFEHFWYLEIPFLNKTLRNTIKAEFLFCRRSVTVFCSFWGLSAGGIRFDNAFVTNSICKPSRAVMLSGLHSHLNGVITKGESLSTDIETFPAMLQQAVYYHYYEGPPRVHRVARHYGVRTGRYTLAHYYDHDEWELFDLEEDPDQLTSVYGEPEYADVQARG